MSSWRWKRSPIEDWTVWAVSSVPPGASIELRRSAKLIARSEQRSEDDAIDVSLGRECVQIGDLRTEAAGHDARTHDERWIGGQRGRDRVREAERQEVRFGIRPEDTEGQDDDTREGLRDDAGGAALLANAAELLGHLLG